MTLSFAGGMQRGGLIVRDMATKGLDPSSMHTRLVVRARSMAPGRSLPLEERARELVLTSCKGREVGKKTRGPGHANLPSLIFSRREDQEGCGLDGTSDQEPVTGAGSLPTLLLFGVIWPNILDYSAGLFAKVTSG